MLCGQSARITLSLWGKLFHVDAIRCRVDNHRTLGEESRVFGKRQRVPVLPALPLAVITTLLLIVCSPAHAQTETVLHSFTGIPDGASPQAGLTFYGGNLYGTTVEGGLDLGRGPGFGTVFELSPNGSGGWNETVIYKFGSAPGDADGASPNTGLIADSNGNLYGTTEFGGAADCVDGDGCGVAYELSPGPDGWTYTLLHTFAGNGDGAFPDTGLAMDSKGNLYGGAGDVPTGAVTYELSPSPTGWTEQVISNLNCQLTMSASGDLFCVSYMDIYELSPNGNGGWNQTWIYSFYGGSSTVVLDQAGNIYGSTYTGPAGNYGIVYKLSPGKHSWKEKTLYTFGNEENGDTPTGVVLDAGGNIYGTTMFGGLYGGGTVFKLVPPVGRGRFTEKVLVNFNGKDGQEPYAGVILDNPGNLYGTTNNGGSLGVGTVYEVTP